MFLRLLGDFERQTRASHAAFWCVPRMFACLCFGALIPHAIRRAGASGSYTIASARHNNSWQQTHAKPAQVMRRFGVCRACLHACAFALQFRTQDATQAHQAAIPARPRGTATLGSYLMLNPRQPCGQHTHALNALMPKQNAAQAQPGICPGASARLNKSIFRSTAPAACVMPLSLRRPR